MALPDGNGEHQCSKEDHLLSALQKRVDSLEHQLQVTNKRLSSVDGQVSSLLTAHNCQKISSNNHILPRTAQLACTGVEEQLPLNCYKTAVV